ncbi:MAG: hypothetical protein LBL05_00050 [Synergistaceae bacterium]|jgi:uncharacterized protein YukE|nr:hypothetical protein [Synergistaceae bacterium]
MGLNELTSTLGKIFIHKEEMRKDIAFLKQAAGSFREGASVCKRGVDSSRWAGESADIFTERYAELAKSVDGQADECERIAKKMEEVIALFEQAEKETQAKIKNFSSGRNG